MPDFRARSPVPAHRRPAPGDRQTGRRTGQRPEEPGRSWASPAAARATAVSRSSSRPSGRRWCSGAQQDACRAAVQRVPRVLPRQRGRVLRLVLRLLPARGVPAALGHVHREGLVAQRRDRQAAPRGDAGALRAARHDHRRERVVHLRPGRAGRLRRDRRCASAWAAATGATACCASWSISSTSATTPPCRAPASAFAATRSSSSRRTTTSSCASSSSATRSSDHRGRPADGRAAGRAQGAQRLSRVALRHAGGEAQGGHRRHREGDGGARRGAARARAWSSRRSGCASGRRSTWR